MEPENTWEYIESFRVSEIKRIKGINFDKKIEELNKRASNLDSDVTRWVFENILECVTGGCAPCMINLKTCYYKLSSQCVI